MTDAERIVSDLKERTGGNLIEMEEILMEAINLIEKETMR